MSHLKQTAKLNQNEYQETHLRRCSFCHKWDMWFWINRKDNSAICKNCKKIVRALSN